MTSFMTAEEAIKDAERLAVINDELIDFEGHNCAEVGDEDCGGWNGTSRRCGCGHRRVAWDAYKDETGAFLAHAVAY